MTQHVPSCSDKRREDLATNRRPNPCERVVPRLRQPNAGSFNDL